MEMTSKEAIELMLNEIVCIDTAELNDCNRECKDCKLVKTSEELHKAYEKAIEALHLLEKQEQGLVQILPCKVGDIIINIHNNDSYKVSSFVIRDNYLSIVTVGDYGYGNLSLKEFNSDYKLKEM